MNVTLRFLVLAASVSGVFCACVSPDEPQITGGQGTNTNPTCDSIAGTWSLDSTTCALSTTCTVSQTGCTGSFTCSDGSSSNSFSVNGSTVTFTADLTAGTASCSGTVSGGVLTGSCDTPKDSCGFTATQNGVVTNSGGSSSGGGRNQGGKGGDLGGQGGSGADVGGGGRGSGGFSGGPSGGAGGVVINPGVCPVTFPVQACNDCMATSCNNACGACGSDSQCNTALSCIYTCSQSGGTCPDCTTGLTDSNSITLFTDFANCLSQTCATECGGSTTTSGQIGDVCTADTDCTVSGAICNGDPTTPGWCTIQCTSDIDCGSNSTGALNYCVQNNGTPPVNVCFPSCVYSTDCSGFPGTSCLTIPGDTRTVCASG